MAFKGFIVTIRRMRPMGMALFPFILVRGKASEILINHEAIHLRQQLELGILPFYAWYLLEYLVRRIQYKNHYLAYRNISFEREAFQNEENLLYLGKRNVWRFVKYL